MWSKINKSRWILFQMHKSEIFFPKLPNVDFINYKRKQVLWFVQYADFESMLRSQKWHAKLIKNKKISESFPPIVLVIIWNVFTTMVYLFTIFIEVMTVWTSFKTIEESSKIYWIKNKNLNLMKFIPKIISNNIASCYICEKFRFMDSVRFLRASLEE